MPIYLPNYSPIIYFFFYRKAPNFYNNLLTKHPIFKFGPLWWKPTNRYQRQERTYTMPMWDQSMLALAMLRCLHSNTNRTSVSQARWHHTQKYKFNVVWSRKISVKSGKFNFRFSSLYDFKLAVTSMISGSHCACVLIHFLSAHAYMLCSLRIKFTHKFWCIDATANLIL